MTRIGNWNEDLFLADEIEKDFEKRKENGELKHQKWARVKSEFLAPVLTSPHGDKVVSMGDVVMLTNLSMAATVAVFSDNKKYYSVTGESYLQMSICLSMFYF